MAMQDDDAPFKVFRLGYSAFAWTSLFIAVVLTVAIMRMLFLTTPDGTSTSRARARVAPTLTALVQGQATRDPNAIDVAVVSEKMVACKACHTLSDLGFSAATCPDLSNIAAVAGQRIADAGYTGAATDAEGYLREALAEPGVYIAPGDPTYGKVGGSLMPVNGGAVLSQGDIDLIVRYLLTLK